MTKYLETRPGSIEDVTRKLREDYETYFKKELEKTGKSIPQMSEIEKKAFFDKVNKGWTAKDEQDEPKIKKAPHGHQLRSGELLLEPKKDDMKKQPKIQQEEIEIKENWTEDLLKKLGWRINKQTYRDILTHPKHGTININRYGEWDHAGKNVNPAQSYRPLKYGKYNELEKYIISLKEATSQDVSPSLENKPQSQPKTTLVAAPGEKEKVIRIPVEKLADYKKKGYVEAEEFVPEEKTVNPYAVGMAAAMKQTGDKSPLKKSTITKAHDIAKSIEKNEEVEIEEAFINARDYASKSKIHSKELKYLKPGQQTDWYEPKTGNKYNAVVVKNDGKEVHIKDEKTGQIHKYKVSDNLEEVSQVDEVIRPVFKGSTGPGIPSGNITKKILGFKNDKDREQITQLLNQHGIRVWKTYFGSLINGTDKDISSVKDAIKKFGYRIEDAQADEQNASQKEKNGEKEIINKINETSLEEGREKEININKEELKRLDVRLSKLKDQMDAAAGADTTDIEKQYYQTKAAIVDIKKKLASQNESIELKTEAAGSNQLTNLNDKISRLQLNLQKLDISKPENKTKEAILKSDLTTTKLKLQNLQKKQAAAAIKTEGKMNYKSYKKTLKKEEDEPKKSSKGKTMTDKPLTPIDVEPKISHN